MPKKTEAFTPRVINSVKIEEALIFSAAEELQKAAKTLRRDMPWVTPRILSGPATDKRQHQRSSQQHKRELTSLHTSLLIASG